MVTLPEKLLTTARTIAVVGFSDKPARESHRIGKYLMDFYQVYPVNPVLAMDPGVYGSLKDVPEKIDIVNVFRRSEFVDTVVEEALAVGAGAVWAQLGVKSDAASKRALDAGLPYVEDTCIFIEHSKLYQGK